MAALPPVLLVLDIGALSSATPREWLEFSRVGSCIIPQVVYDEMRFLFDRSPDPDLERIARAFNRFYPTSGWKLSEGHAHHTILKSGSGQALTKRSRISLSAGRCALSTAQEFPSSLVVLVSSDRSMLQRIYDIQASNLCSVTGASLLQWCRTGQRPVAVSQKLQQLRVALGSSNAPINSTSVSQPYPTTTTSRPPASTSRITSVPSSPVSRVTSTQSTRVQPKKTVIQNAPYETDWLPQLVSLLSALALLVVAGLILWQMFRNVDFTNWKNNPDATEQSQ